MGPFMKDDLLISPVKNEIPNSKFFKKNSQKESKIDQSNRIKQNNQKTPTHRVFEEIRFVLFSNSLHHHVLKRVFLIFFEFSIEKKWFIKFNESHCNYYRFVNG